MDSALELMFRNFLAHEVPIGFCNICSVSMIPSSLQSAGFKVLGNLVATHPLAIGMTLGPVFAYKRNSVFSEAYTVLKQLTSFGTMDVDKKYYLAFSKRAATSMHEVSMDICRL